MDNYFDKQFLSDSVRVICGVDEAGRGPLAGPVVAGACVLPENCEIEFLNDSKKLSEKKRDALYDVITEKALFWGVGIASEKEIDEINILEASLLAMRRAIEASGVSADLVLVDGNVDRGFKEKAIAVIGGDALSPSIAAASIIAKVTRDRMMAELDREYPGYGLAGHKGYPTKAHKLAVYRLGASSCHRKSFLSFLERDREKLALWDAEDKAKQK
ncbi:MAG: ribonuclease HII [Clostridia bacterium]|nr:ribonuclease HII [Clostridia bacterium]